MRACLISTPAIKYKIGEGLQCSSTDMYFINISFNHSKWFWFSNIDKVELPHYQYFIYVGKIAHYLSTKNMPITTHIDKSET